MILKKKFPCSMNEAKGRHCIAKQFFSVFLI